MKQKLIRFESLIPPCKGVRGIELLLNKKSPDKFIEAFKKLLFKCYYFNNASIVFKNSSSVGFVLEENSVTTLPDLSTIIL